MVKTKMMRNHWVEIALFVGTLAVFLVCPVGVPTDSRFSIYLSERVLHGQSLSLEQTPELMTARQIMTTNGGLFYRYPYGSSVLSLPFVAVLNRLGLSATNADGSINDEGEGGMQRLLASFLMALLTVLLYRIARLLLPAAVSVWLALSAAFGSQIFSSASRTLWSHTWLILLIAGCIYLLVRNATQDAPISPTLMGTLSAWIFFVRPSGVISVLAISAYLPHVRGFRWMSYALCGTAWVVAFSMHSQLTFGQSLPPYYQSVLQFGWTPQAVLGHLISPSRGLFVFVPVTLLVLVVCACNWSRLPHRALAGSALAAIALHYLAISSWPDWCGGFSYGPRLWTDVLPWWFLLAVLSVAAVSHSPNRRLVLTCGMLLSVVGIIMNAPAALTPLGQRWNDTVDVAHHPERAWDLHHPQFLAWTYRPAKSKVR